MNSKQLEEHIKFMPLDEYLAADALSCTGLKKLMVSPLAYEHYKTAQRSESPAMRFGSLVHALVLEPAHFQDRYFIAPDVDKRTKAGKLMWEESVEAARGRVLITDTEFDRAQEVELALRASGWLSKMDSGWPVTEAVFRAHTQFGLLQCRFDRITGGDELQFYDLKTVRSAAEFDRQFWSLGYHWQQVFYTYIIEALTGEIIPPIHFVAVETEPPYDVIVRTTSDELYHLLKTRLEAALSLYAECRDADHWPGIDGWRREVKVLTEPVWVQKDAESVLVGVDLDAVFG